MMDVNNSLAPNRRDTAVEYRANDESVKLTASGIRRYFAANATDQEVTMFMSLCRYQHLNPFLREAYLIKYGNSPATMVVGKDVFVKRAKRNKAFAGMQAGIIVQTEGGAISEREGSFFAAGENIVGGWAKVYIKGYETPVYASVSFAEYAGRKNDGSLNKQWAGKPATMIRKVALTQALREAFPEDFGGMYAQEEMPEVSGETLDETPIEQPADPEIIEANDVQTALFE